VVAAAVVVIAVTNPFSSAATSRGVSDNAYPISLVAVKRGPLSSQVTGVGTLGHAARSDGSPYELVNQASGRLTALPASGQVIGQGQVLYRVDNNPVVLLNGPTPAYRSINSGDSGPDVRELNAALVALGDAPASALDPTSEYFGSATALALKRLQGKLGVDQTGSLALGDAIFLPGPIRIAKVTATPGTSAPPGGSIAQATSTRRQIEVNIDAAEQSSLKTGDRVLITLPNYRDTTGVVARLGTVANGSSSATPTIPVYIRLAHPQDAGTLDQAPVRVQITTAGVTDALIVPVDALLAQPGSGYAVETVDAHRVHQLVAVTPGLFDDADGLVQVSSNRLAAGQQIVVPAA
jgi:peptidoglycan hydrolase-like protein with peptidoglycan-binding domain